MDEATPIKHILVAEMLIANEKCGDKFSELFPEQERIKQNVNGYNIPFIRVPLSPVQEQFLGELLTIDKAQNVDDYIATTDGAVVIKERDDCALFKEKDRGVLSDIEETLLSLSKVTGIEFVLHTDPILVPQHASDGQINVILGAPPGSGNPIKRTAHPETGKSYSLWGVGRAVCEGAARGWGEVIEGPDELPIAQIIGRNFYLFVSTHKIALPILPEGSGADMFGYAMRMAWNAFIRGVKEPEQHPLDNPDMMQMFLGMTESIETVRRGKELERLQTALSDIRAQYQDTLNQIRRVEGLLRPSIARVADVITDPPSWDEATGHPLFERMYTAEHLLHVETKPVVVEGRMLDAYTLRFDTSLTNDRWNVVIYNTKKPLHPLAIPHPHISKHGGVCFGNVGLLIDEALINHNIPRAIKLALQWLAKGYDADIARHKIEEWPLAEADTTKEAA